MKLTKEIIKNWIDIKDNINDKVYEITEAYIKYGEVQQLALKARWGIDSWAYGGYENYSLSFSLDYLFDYDYEKELIQQKEKRDEENRLREEEKKKKELEKQKDEYLKLKNLFENHDKI
jgi:hypothetical protein